MTNQRPALEPSRRALYLLAALAIVAGLILVMLGDQTPVGIATSVIALAAAVLVGSLVPRHPRAAFGMLLVLSSISKVTIDIQAGNLRLEQPAILAALAMIVLANVWPRKDDLRPVAIVALCFAAYLGVLTLSSALYAPQFATSARMIIWTAVSMAGGAVAFTLLVRDRNAERVSEFGWFTATGVFHAGLGLAVAVAFLVLGPDGIPGMQVSPGEPPKVAGLAWEANIYASVLGAIAPFALERFRVAPRFATAWPAILIIVAMGLGVTRGAYLGLAVGLAVYAVILFARFRARVQWAPLVALAIAASLMAPVASGILLPAGRPHGGIFAGASPTPQISPRPGETASPTPAVTPSPPVDTFAFRLDRVPLALEDLRRSPIIGLGAATFGQRHSLPYHPEIPDYLGTLALVALYETGLAGLLLLVGGFLLVLWLLFVASRRNPGEAAAYIAALVSLLVAYQATNALFFSFIWLITGAALAFVVRSRHAFAVLPVKP